MSRSHFGTQVDRDRSASARRPRRRGVHRSGARQLLGFESLEGRTLLATVVTVTTTVDEFDVPATVTVGSLGTGGPDGTDQPSRGCVVAATRTPAVAPPRS